MQQIVLKIDARPENLAILHRSGAIDLPSMVKSGLFPMPVLAEVFGWEFTLREISEPELVKSLGKILHECHVEVQATRKTRVEEKAVEQAPPAAAADASPAPPPPLPPPPAPPPPPSSAPPAPAAPQVDQKVIEVDHHAEGGIPRGYKRNLPKHLAPIPWLDLTDEDLGVQLGSMSAGDRLLHWDWLDTEAQERIAAHYRKAGKKEPVPDLLTARPAAAAASTSPAGTPEPPAPADAPKSNSDRAKEFVLGMTHKQQLEWVLRAQSLLDAATAGNLKDEAGIEAGLVFAEVKPQQLAYYARMVATDILDKGKALPPIVAPQRGGRPHAKKTEGAAS